MLAVEIKIKSVSKHKCLQSVESYTNDTTIPQKKIMSKVLSSSLYHHKDQSTDDTTLAVAIPATGKDVSISVPSLVIDQQPSLLPTLEPYNGDIDFLDDSVLLNPEVDRILSEISSSQVNVRNDFTESTGSVCPNIQISNVSGGVFNFYVSK